jgi:hypothetical protein
MKKREDPFDPLWVQCSSGKASGRQVIIEEVAKETGESVSILMQLPNKILFKKLRKQYAKREMH